MSVPAKMQRDSASSLAVLEDDIPILFEDEEEEMGTANPHAWADYLLFGPVGTVIARRHPDHQVFRDLNCYYKVKGRKSQSTGRDPNFASDIMIVRPKVLLPFETTSYTIGVDGPVPLAAVEILSAETAAERDLETKLEIYRKLKIKEYILVDLTGQLLPQKILLKRLQGNGRWKDMMDGDGGLTSELGFRLILDPDSDPLSLYVVDAATGNRVARPHEAEQHKEEAEQRKKEAEQNKKRAERAEREKLLAEAKANAAIEAQRLAEERLKELQAQIDRQNQTKEPYRE